MTKIYSLDKLDPIAMEAVRGSTAQAGIYVTPMLIRRFKGDGNTTIIFKRLLYCSEQWAGEEGWFFQTAGTFEKVTGLGNRALQRSINRLEKMGLIEKKLRGIPYKAHYRVNLSAYLELIRAESSLATSGKVSVASNGETNLVSSGETSSAIRGKEVILSESNNDLSSDTYPPIGEKLIQATADLFDEVKLETPKEIDATLRDAGYDPDEVGARMKAVADRAIVDQIIKQTETHPGPEDLCRNTLEKRAEAGGNYAAPSHAGGADVLADDLIAIYCQHMGEALPRGGEIISCRAAINKVLKAKGLQQDGRIAKRGMEILLDPDGEYGWYHDKYTLSVGNKLFVQHYGKVLARLIAGGDGYSKEHKKGKSHATHQQHIAPHAAIYRVHTADSAAPFIKAIYGED